MSTPPPLFETSLAMQMELDAEAANKKTAETSAVIIGNVEPEEAPAAPASPVEPVIVDKTKPSQFVLSKEWVPTSIKTVEAFVNGKELRNYSFNPKTKVWTNVDTNTVAKIPKMWRHKTGGIFVVDGVSTCEQPVLVPLTEDIYRFNAPKHWGKTTEAAVIVQPIEG